MSETHSLLFFTGDWTASSRPQAGAGWCVREAYCLRCKLCGGKVDPRDVFGHGHGHLEAARDQYESFLVVLAMAKQAREPYPLRDIGEVVETVFGFRPNTPAATEFWKQHGGTEP